MQAFVWNERFETGIASVDEQHRRLVEFVNEMGEVLIDGSSTDKSINDIFSKLAEYALYHFADEERLMTEVGLMQSSVELHQLHHQQFVTQLTGMWKGRADLVNPAEVLHGFLSSWLAFHILEEDQSMARQLTLIAQGITAQDAFFREQVQADNSSAVLLSAMH